MKKLPKFRVLLLFIGNIRQVYCQLLVNCFNTWEIAERMEPIPKKSKRVVWNHSDEVEVIALWEEYENDLRREKRNSHLYAEIAGRMNGRYSAQEIHVKKRNLTQKYRSEKKDIGPSGGCPSKWVHYNSVHKIIGSTAANNSELVESFLFDIPAPSSASSESSPMFVPILDISPLSSSSFSSSIRSPVPSPDPDSVPGTSRKRKKSIHEKPMRENIEKQTELQEKQIKLQDKQLTVIQDLCQDFGSFLERQQQTDEAFLNIFRNLADKM